MIDRHAGTEDFDRWARKARDMSVDALAYSAQDALEASHLAELAGNYANAGRYRDEALTYLAELERRHDRILALARDAVETRDRAAFGAAAADALATQAAHQILAQLRR